MTYSQKPIPFLKVRNLLWTSQQKKKNSYNENEWNIFPQEEIYLTILYILANDQIDVWFTERA